MHLLFMTNQIYQAAGELGVKASKEPAASPSTMGVSPSQYTAYVQSHPEFVGSLPTYLQSHALKLANTSNTAPQAAGEKAAHSQNRGKKCQTTQKPAE